MGTIGTEIDAKFVLALGDNFYNTGVTSDTSSRFSTSWSTVYNSGSMKTLPWYVIAGNHDHEGNVTAEVEFTNLDPTKRWNYPDFFYKKSFSGDGVSIDVIMIDTVDLCGSNKVQDHGVEGYFDPLPTMDSTATNTNWQWIEDQMAASTADYLFIGGHYPVYSVCEHGPTQTLIDNLQPLLVKYNAHYLSGHDHCLEYFVEGKVSYILSGTGDECCYSASNSNNKLNPTGALKFSVSSSNNPNKVTGGFVSISTSATSMIVKYYDQDGNVLYSSPPVPPR